MAGTSAPAADTILTLHAGAFTPARLCLLVAAAAALAFLGAACGGSGAAHAELVVSPRGSAGGDGSTKRPLDTIGRALRRARPGMTIVVRAGRYTGNVSVLAGGRDGAPLVIRADDGARPVIAGRLWLSARYVDVSGLVVDGSGLAGGVAVHVAGGSHLSFSDGEVRGAAKTGIFVDGNAGDVSILRNLVHGNGRRGRLDSAVELASGHDARVEGNVVHGNRANGVTVYPAFDDAVVSQNTIADNSGDGVLVGGEAQTSDRTTVVNNVVAYNGGQGIRSYWARAAGKGNRVINNLIHANGSADVSVAGLARQENISGDPRFVDRAHGDYRLQSGSSAIGQAREDYVAERDLTGRSRPHGARADLGAYER